MTFRTRLIVLLVSTPLVAFAIVGGLLGKTVMLAESYQHLRVFEDVVSLIVNNYVEEADIERVMEGAMRGLADGLDAETSYLTPGEVSLFERRVPPERGGVGLDLTRQFYLRVVAVRDGSPAARAGLRTGDVVRAIDGDSTRHMSLFEGTNRLHGPAASKLSLTVMRGNAADVHEVALVREVPADQPPTLRTAGPGVAVVRVPSFVGDVVAGVRTRIDQAVRDGAERLILDLRATTEGPIENGIALARLFVASGTLAQWEVRGQSPQAVTASGGDGAVMLPSVVLVSAGTAGAAEVFAAALAGNDRAQLIGEHTIGRAGSQKLVKFADGSGLLLTSGRYLTPSGEPIQGAGLEPDERVQLPEVEFGEAPPSNDPILERAIERLNAGRVAA